MFKWIRTARLKHAARLASAGDLEKAEEVLGRILAGDPGEVSALTQYAELATTRKDWVQAVERWERLWEVCEQAGTPLPQKAPGRLRVSRLKHAGQLSSTGDLDGAEGILTRILGEDPNDLAAMIQYAELATTRKDWVQAVERWERLWEVCEQAGTPLPQKAPGRLRVSRLKHAGQLSSTGDLDGAEGILTRILGEDPNDLAAMIQYAELATTRKDWVQAVERWERLWEVCEQAGTPLPQKAPGRLKVARLKHAGQLSSAGDLDGAEGILTRILGEDPNDLAAMIQYAELATTRKDWVQAVERWERLWEVCEQAGTPLPQKAPGRLRVSRLKHAGQLSSAGDLDGAEEVLGRILAGDPGEVSALIQYAELATTRKDWVQAVERWERLWEVCEQAGTPLPQKAPGRLRVSRLKHAGQLSSAGDLDGAEGILTRILGEDPDEVSALTQYAELATTRKDWVQAVERWERLWEVSEQAGIALSQKVAVRLKTARLKHAAKLSSAGDTDSAEALLKRILAEEPEDLGALSQFARVAMVRRDWSQAAERWAATLEIQRDGLDFVLVQMSIAYRNQGLPDKAIGILTGAEKCGIANDALRFQLAKMLAEKADWEKAGRVTRDIIASNKPLSCELPFATFAARVFWRLRDIEQASAIIERALIGRDPKEIPAKTLAIKREIGRRIQLSTKPGSLEVSTSYYDDIYQESHKYRVEGQNSPYIPVWEEIVARINGYKSKSVLDVGCGPGQFSEYIMQQCPLLKYIGVDFSKVAVERARIRCPSATFIEENILNSEILTQHGYDTIILLEVLEHIEEDLTLLEKIPRGKILLASVPNFDSFGHVRFFKSSNEVKERYTSLFSTLTILPISIRDLSTIFVISGVKA
jgi:lipopolysaccharide biosynthesis regulator YciM